MKDRYVLLTGSRNNAGDFLIKARAKQLLRHLRPERELLDWDRWKPLSDAQVEEANASRALILCGGPGLRPDMWPAVYPLVGDLERIRVPILALGTGWKAAGGTWQDTHDYRFSAQTHRLLRRIEESGVSSVRDYHSLNVLERAGYRSFRMTGCPASYSIPHLAKPARGPDEAAAIGFSLGVGFIRSASLEAQARELLGALRAAFPRARIVVALHHSPSESGAADGAAFRQRHERMLDWLRAEGLAAEDISGSDERLQRFYDGCDWHVGYRVHAHLYMCSLSKPSVLIAEDARGAGVRGVIGGMVFSAGAPAARRERLLQRLALSRARDPFRAVTGLAQDVAAMMQHEIRAGYPRLRAVRAGIDAHWEVMRGFVSSLP